MGRIRERKTVFGVHSPSTFNGKKFQFSYSYTQEQIVLLLIVLIIINTLHIYFWFYSFIIITIRQSSNLTAHLFHDDNIMLATRSYVERERDRSERKFLLISSYLLSLLFLQRYPNFRCLFSLYKP